MTDGRRALLFGSTGLVGGHLARALLDDPGVSRVVAPVRRTHAASGGRIVTPLVDFDDLAAHAGELAADQVFLCLGTTRKKAGSPEAFRKVDLHYTVEAARVARAGGAEVAFLVSSVGADPTARSFYLRVKGEAEDALGAVGFRSLHVFRPSLLTGERHESRPGERVGALLGAVVAPLLVGRARRYRPVSALDVARAMAAVARDPAPGAHVHESETIETLAAAEAG